MLQCVENVAYTPSDICLDYPSWQFILDISELCYFVVSLESSVLPHWGEESGGRIRENDVRILPPPITRPPGVWSQEGLWPGREVV